MGAFFKQFEALIWTASTTVGVLLWAYTSFATKEYVNQKHESVVQILSDIRDTVKTMEQRQYELVRRH